MSVVYASGVMLSYLLNRRRSFGRRAGPLGDVRRQAVVSVAGSVLNLGALSVLVDVVGLAHRFVQAVMVYVVATLTSGLQKVGVFRAPRRAAPRSLAPDAGQ